MDYAAIGKRIRAHRKRLNLSQEELAEMVNISTVHMSHIETGYTKLSLPVLVDLACKADNILIRCHSALDQLGIPGDRCERRF